ncbi:MAG: hypothetical protein F6K39_27245 [Okeania sp. SIO3B3]|nr:hypothetical protein [Okeania sp. SIO3B3]
MKYAESLLLGGELIDADNANYDSYKDLLMRCPACGSEVFLSRGFTRTTKTGRRVVVSSTWKHFKEVDIAVVRQCERRCQYKKTEVQSKNSSIRRQRLKAYRHRIWELIKKSPLVDTEDLQPRVNSVLDDPSFRWFIESSSRFLRHLHEGDGIQKEVENVIRQIISDDNATEPGNIIVRDLLIQDKYLDYRKQITGEALEFCFQHWSRNELHKLMTLGLWEVSQTRILNWQHKMAECLLENLSPPYKKMFVEVWNRDRYQGMDIVDKSTSRFQQIKELLLEGMEYYISQLVTNLVVAFLTIPWLEELKKING